MKFLTILTTVVISGIFAVGTAWGEDTLEQKLKKRCTGIQAKSYTSDFERARDYYFYGDRCVSKSEDKKAWHNKGLDAAKKAIDESSTPEQLALSNYYAAINLSRWGLATGILTALNRWSDVKGYLKKVVENGVSTADYGVYRVLGRAYYKLPTIKVGFGKYKKSEKYLETAYTKTLHPTFKTSTNVLTTLYYLNTLQKQDNDSVFCTVYEKLNGLVPFNEAKATKLNSQLVIENLLDMQNFVKPPKSDKGEYIEQIREYADINC